MRWVYGQGREERMKSPRPVLRAGDLLLVRVLAPGGPGVKARVALEQDPDVEGALLCQDVRSGAVLAMVGGFDFARNQYNRALQARRQPRRSSPTTRRRWRAGLTPRASSRTRRSSSRTATTAGQGLAPSN
jgi:membrane carboxypeptidase/penicillin-binding protein